MAWRRKSDGRPFADLRKFGLGRRSLLTPAIVARWGLAPPDDVCEAEYQEILAHARECPAAPPRLAHTPQTLVDWYVDVYHAGSAPGTRETYGYCLAKWIEWCALNRMESPEDFDALAAQSYAAWLLQKQKAGGVRGYIKVLRYCLKAGRENGVLGSVGVQHWPKIRKPRASVKHYTPDQIRRILAAVEQYRPRFYSLILFLAASGWDISSAITLRHDQIDYSRRTANRRRGKTGTGMNLPLNQTALEAIRLAGTRDGEVFLILGRTHNRHSVLRALREARDLAGLQFPVNLHKFRHTVAVELARAGTPLRVIAEILGQDPKTTYEHYQEFAPGSGVGAMDAWGEQLRGDGEAPGNVIHYIK